MTIEFIDDKNKFFSDVKILGKKNSSTLGFMPEGGFEDYAKKRCIIIAADNDILCGYIMYREVPRYSRISIVHLCVDCKYRGKGLTKLLLDTLRLKYENSYNYHGILLSCRDDYKVASNIWRKYGFVPRDEVRSRSMENHSLKKWWYDFNRQDLFSLTNTTTSKISALLDANIIIKLRDSANTYEPTEDPRCIMADWLIEETELYYAPEMYNEIDRDANKQRAIRTKQFLSSFVEAKYSIERAKQIAYELSAIIQGKTDNDISDRKQLATCIAAEIKYFITFDKGIIAAKDKIESLYDVDIITPQEFVVTIDKLVHKETYSPRNFQGAVLHTLSKLSNEEIEVCIDEFWYRKGYEDKKAFRNLVYRVINSSNYTIDTIKNQEECIAFFAYAMGDDNISIPIIRVKEYAKEHTVFMGVIENMISLAIKENKMEILVSESQLSEEQKVILAKFGFLFDSCIYKKYVCCDVICKDDISSYMESRGINISILDSKNDANLLTIERILFPLKIYDINIPCYIIPIKPYWAGELFDKSIAGENLFGANVSKLWNVENVYYRHTKPITEKFPARILWYASSGKGTIRNKAILACSYLDEVFTGLPKELFKMHKHYGVYEWRHIYDLCDKNINNPIRALKFSQTEVFKKTVPYSSVIKILGKNNTFASPVETSTSVFTQIYNLRNEK